MVAVMKLDRPVIVTGVGGPAGRSLALQLTQRQIWVVGTDCRKVSVKGIESVVVPPANDPTFEYELRELAQNEGACLMVPTVSEELPVLAALTGFPIPLLLAPIDSVALANDKALTMAMLANCGVAVPKTLLPTDDQWRIDGLGQTVISKPRVGRGGRGVMVMEAPINRMDVPPGNILQSFASGIEYDVNVWIGADQTNDSSDKAIVLVKTELAHGNIGNATEVQRLTGPEVDDVAALAIRAARAIGLSGPVDIDIRRLASGQPVVLEINARFGANSAFAPELVDSLIEVIKHLSIVAPATL
jgi:carbamoylphosphate synthase large subunit